MPKQEFWMKVLLGILYVASLVSIGLWMAGYMHTERVTYTRFGEVRAEKEIKEYIQQAEHIKNQHSIDENENDIIETENDVNEGYNIKTSDDQVQDVETETKIIPLETSVPSEASVDTESNLVPHEDVEPGLEEEPRELDIAYNLDDLEATINLGQYTPVKVLATGYTAGIESTGKEPGHPQYGITYSGVQVRRDLYSTIAADPDIFPIGTILYIPNYGYGVVADIGSAITGNKIDLYYETVENVYNLWGKQELEVYVIQKGEGKVTETMLDELNQNEVLQAFKQR